MEYEIKCKHCNRFLAKATKSVEVELKCSNSKCKQMAKYKVVFMSDYNKRHEHGAAHNIATTPQV